MQLSEEMLAKDSAVQYLQRLARQLNSMTLAQVATAQKPARRKAFASLVGGSAPGQRCERVLMHIFDVMKLQKLLTSHAMI